MDQREQQNAAPRERPNALLEQPVGQRIEEFRLEVRWPELMAQLADGDVEVRQ